MKLNKLQISILIIITGVILITLVMLYNFSFKYNKHDPLFVSIIERSEKLDDKYVSNRLINSFTLLTDAFNSSFEQKTEVFYKVKNAEFTQDYAKSIIQKNLKDVQFGSGRECFANSYTDLYNRTYNEHFKDNFFHFKANGYSYAMSLIGTSCRGRYNQNNNTCAMGYVDINGAKGPNQLGVDLFDFGLYNYSVRLKRPNDSHNVVTATFPLFYGIADEVCYGNNGIGCAYSVYKYGNRNYLSRPINRSSYTFIDRYKHIYITPNGKWVFFTNNGYIEPVTFMGVIKNIQSFFISNYVAAKLNVGFKVKDVKDVKNAKLSAFYEKYPKLKIKHRSRENGDKPLFVHDFRFRFNGKTYYYSIAWY